MKDESPDLLRIRQINERKEAMSKEDITEDMIEHWMGSDNLGVDDFLELLVSIVNGYYKVEMFKEDVIDLYASTTGEEQ